MNKDDITPKQKVVVANDCYGFKAGTQTVIEGNKPTFGKSGKTVMVQQGVGTGLFVDLDNLKTA